jgi:hypothetical protein
MALLMSSLMQVPSSALMPVRPVLTLVEKWFGQKSCHLSKAVATAGNAGPSSVIKTSFLAGSLIPKPASVMSDA